MCRFFKSRFSPFISKTFFFRFPPWVCPDLVTSRTAFVLPVLHAHRLYTTAPWSSVAETRASMSSTVAVSGNVKSVSSDSCSDESHDDDHDVSSSSLALSFSSSPTSSAAKPDPTRSASPTYRLTSTAPNSSSSSSSLETRVASCRYAAAPCMARRPLRANFWYERKRVSTLQVVRWYPFRRALRDARLVFRANAGVVHDRRGFGRV